MTEKGRRHSLEVRLKNRKFAAATVENKIKEIENLMKDKRVDEVEEEYELFLDLFEDFQCHHKSYRLLLCDEEDDKYGEETEQKFLHFKTVVTQWISEAVNDTVLPIDSVSQRPSTTTSERKKQRSKNKST
ncbi:hypothetical protein SNE40_004488 [Patella caerulea]|uniref:Uncharacterized protein n=1 Tax=Patella caerulea TaxID=87958 RepID=A0AAN8Q125_PATCE